ncbi:hypothetical protein CBL_00709 [Carabus blaptoides fortunei]
MVTVMLEANETRRLMIVTVCRSPDGEGGDAVAAAAVDLHLDGTAQTKRTKEASKTHGVQHSSVGGASGLHVRRHYPGPKTRSNGGPGLGRCSLACSFPGKLLFACIMKPCTSTKGYQSVSSGKERDHMDIPAMSLCMATSTDPRIPTRVWTDLYNSVASHASRSLRK